MGLRISHVLVLGDTAAHTGSGGAVGAATFEILPRVAAEGAVETGRRGSRRRLVGVGGTGGAGGGGRCIAGANETIARVAERNTRLAG